VLTAETLHCIGLGMLLFLILPYMDAPQAALMLCSVGTVPSLLRLFVAQPQVKSNSATQWLAIDRIMAVATFALQLISLAAWTVVGRLDSVKSFYLIPIALFFGESSSLS